MEHLHLVEDSLGSLLVPDGRVRRNPRAEGYEVCAPAVTSEVWGSTPEFTRGNCMSQFFGI